MITATSIFKHKLKRVFLRFSFLFPAMISAASLWLASGYTTSTGLVGLAVGGIAIGLAVYRFTVGANRLHSQAVEAARKQSYLAHRRYLRSFSRKLRRDRDQRTNDALQRLQNVYDRLDKLAASQETASLFEQLQATTTSLYESSLRMLGRTLDLWDTGQKLATDKAREEIRENRESILGQVQQSIHHLNELLDHVEVQNLKFADADSQQHQELRKQLEEGLEVARRVEERMVNMEKEMGLRVPE
jgi:hypothetical protein